MNKILTSETNEIISITFASYLGVKLDSDIHEWEDYRETMTIAGFVAERMHYVLLHSVKYSPFIFSVL